MSVRFLAQEPDAEIVESQPSAVGSPLRGKKWLVLEDETAIRDVLKALLSVRGYEVSMAANSDEAEDREEEGAPAGQLSGIFHLYFIISA